MLRFDDVQLFVEMADAGSISAGGRRLGIGAATASAALKRLEQRLQAQLFERSTRSLRLTQAGESFLGHCRHAMQQLQEGQAALQRGRQGLQGDIHLGAPSDLGRGTLDELLEPFRRAHPGIRLVMHLSDALHDLYRQPVDLVLRYGALRDSAMVARQLCDNDRVIVASPEYLRRRGRPKSVQALAQHNCICFYLGGELRERWTLHFEGRGHEVQVRGDRAADDGAIVRQWALQGHGVVYKSRLDIRSDLAARRLVELSGCDVRALSALRTHAQPPVPERTAAGAAAVSAGSVGELEPQRDAKVSHCCTLPLS